MTHTKDKLAAAILDVATEHRHYRMADKAAQGYYDDYLSPLATPCVQLVKDARQFGLHTIAERAMAGEFDGTKEESEAWARSPEGQKAAAELSPEMRAVLGIPTVQ